MKYYAVLLRGKGWIVLLCPEFDLPSEEKTVEEVIKNLKGVGKLYLEDEDTKSESVTVYHSRVSGFCIISLRIQI